MEGAISDHMDSASLNMGLEWTRLIPDGQICFCFRGCSATFEARASGPCTGKDSALFSKSTAYAYKPANSFISYSPSQRPPRPLADSTKNLNTHPHPPTMTHYIRTIHTSFTSGTPSSSSSSSSAWVSSTPYATTSASAHANILVNLGGIMNKYPPGLGHSEWRSSPSSSNGPPYTKRRTSVSLRVPSSRRPAPPPPTVSRTQPASVTHMKFDPFSDENAPLDTVLYHTPAPPSAPRSYSAAPRTYTVHIPHVDRDKDARSRLVAGILLNRVHAVGKPMRGRRPSSAPKEYVRSGLSRVVSVEA
jgi:hypothetical protein